MRIAAARIVEARALLGITQADQLPEVSAGVEAVNQRLPQSPGRPPIETSATQVGLWPRRSSISGAIRRATVSARASFLSEVGTTSHHQLAGQRCGGRVLPAARTGSRTGDLPETLPPEQIRCG